VNPSEKKKAVVTEARGGDRGWRRGLPVLAPEAEHVGVVGARLHRLEALERRHRVPEQQQQDPGEELPQHLAGPECGLPHRQRDPPGEEEEAKRRRGGEGRNGGRVEGSGCFALERR
jgi:hypothetical protein